ncbi:MAG TPA: xanthine/uracil/vitamin C permease, partial [Roseovarius sp.]|nr:xanthine/uracil/vitamin C permease [Roseovarius sp.]
GGFALAACAMSLVGIIHSATLHWPEPSGVSMGYLIAAAFLLVYPVLHRDGIRSNVELPLDAPETLARD